MNKHPVPKLFRTAGHMMGASELPDYVVKNGRFYRTVHHPGGWSEKPELEMRNDGKIYKAGLSSPEPSALPIYEFHTDRRLYRTAAHPSGIGGQPDYEIRD